MTKDGIRIFLAHGPTLSKFLGHLGSEFGNPYSLSLVLLEVYFTYPLESLKSDNKCESYVHNTKFGRNWESGTGCIGTLYQYTFSSGGVYRYTTVHVPVHLQNFAQILLIFPLLMTIHSIQLL